MSSNPIQSTIIQSTRPPFESVDEIKDHAAALRKIVTWTTVGILCDDGPSAMLVVLLSGDTAVGVARFCLSVEDSLEALCAYQQGSEPFVLAVWQGHEITGSQLVSLEDVSEIWQQTQDQAVSMSSDDITEFFERIEKATKEKGRTRKFSGDTRAQVWFESHGRCMFEGCGKDLTIDPTTGRRGNFAYLAHNVASSETGPRGVLYLSGRLADEPQNILLLCDTHHRLIDTVARADYPADRLSDMRRRFSDTASGILDGLARLPIPAFCVSWPVHQQVISTPSALQIAQALVPIGARVDGAPNILSDNEDTLRCADLETLWSLMPREIESTADRILMQLQHNSFRAALFAMGRMPALIGLGAKLGNKCEVTPMLRHRESGLWCWPAEVPQSDVIEIAGLDQLSEDEGEVTIQLALTAKPKPMDVAAERLQHRIVVVSASEDRMGNGAIAHPLEGSWFRQRVQELLHLLRDKHGVHLVHLLPCASNAASMFFGQAYDDYHSDMLVYDFDSNGYDMIPRLRISNLENRCIVGAAGLR